MPEPALIITCDIDARRLNAAFALAQEFSKRTPSELVNTASAEVAIGAANRMPVVATSTIDSQLSVMTTPVIGKRGKALKNRKQFKATSGGQNVPFAALLVNARVTWTGSRYNVMTHGRYAIPNSPFKGLTRVAGRAAMAEFINKMIASRHSSTSFLKAGWIPVIKKALSYSVNRFRRGSSLSRSVNSHDDLGSFIPAQKGATQCYAIISNDVGEVGLNAQSFNQALLKYGTPGLQAAIDDEGVKQMNYYLDRAGREELEKPFNSLAS